MTQTMTDPYAVLGIARDATHDQVRQAYRRLAKSHHPDLHPDAATSERMRRINQAWQTLSRPPGHPTTSHGRPTRPVWAPRPEPGTDPGVNAPRYAPTAPDGRWAARPRSSAHVDDGPGPIAIVVLGAVLLMFGTIGVGFPPLLFVAIFLFLAARART